MTHEQVIQFYAQQVVGRYPVPSGVIAQLILECGWDISTPKDMTTGQDSYNVGNIKGVGTNGYVTVVANEFYSQADIAAAKANGTFVRATNNFKNGLQEVYVKCKFKAYRNYAEAIDDHFSLLKKQRYVDAGLWNAKTPREYAEALKRAGYATDPIYVDKIMSIVNAHNLTQFDKPVAPKYPTVRAMVGGQLVPAIAVNNATHLHWGVLKILGITHEYKGDGLFIIQGRQVQGVVYEGHTYLNWGMIAPGKITAKPLDGGGFMFPYKA